MDSSLYKDVNVSRGLNYRYYHSPASHGKPTLLFLHGFPSSSYDWHRQIEYLQPKGYGLIVPDGLGVGGTSKPDSPEAYRFALMARDIVDILDAEGIQKVVGIGHDWGSVVLSRLANLYSERMHAFGWIALSYTPPAPQLRDVDTMIAEGRAQTGNDLFGYWKYFSKDDAYRTCEKNIDSFVQLLYPISPQIWYDWFSPVGKAEEWLETNRTPGRPQWLSQEEYDVIRATLSDSGLRSLVNYYKGWVKGVNVEDDKGIPEDAIPIRKPALFIAATRDSVCTAVNGKFIMSQLAPHAKIVELDVGHWAHMEATEEVNRELESWVENLGISA
ncbi:alpha/beta-hydrolase [Trametes punicea]|nr:alpha/beta-hydrolase [Trametes punicea]